MNADTVSKLIDKRNRRSVESMEQEAADIIGKIASKQAFKEAIDKEIIGLRAQLLALEAEQHTVGDILGTILTIATE